MSTKITSREAIKLFCEECQSYGLSVSEETLIANGKKQRCPVIQSRYSKTSGCYWLHASNDNDFPFNGFIYNFNTAAGNQSWNVMPYIKKHKFLKVANPRIYQTNQTYKQNINQEERFERVAHIAYKIYKQSNKLPTGLNYLDIKQIRGFGVKFQSYKDDNNILIVPGRDLDGKIWTLQLINSKKNKHFLKNGKLSGLCHKIGFINLPSNYQGNLMICEGYATGASIYMATEFPTICAFNSGNLPIVGDLVKTRWPLSKIIYCADVDYVGISKAIQAKELTGGYVIIPIVNDSRENVFTDFNDLHCNFGLEIVKEQILQQVNLTKIHNDILAESIFENKVEESEISAKSLEIAEKYISTYLIRKFAINFGKIAHNQQLDRLNAINPKYKALALKGFVMHEALRILNFSSLDARHKELAKICTKFQYLVKIGIQQLLKEKQAS